MNIQPFTPVTTFKAGTVNGLDTSQKHQLQFFSDAGSQTSWFNSHMTYTYDNLTPLKFSGTTNVIKLPIVADLLQNCNYCMFLNANFNNNKWYYAFITNVRAISPNACEVTLKIDTYQTYYFEASVQPCFVVREHVNNDTIGLHTIDEGLETGEYLAIGTHQTHLFDGATLVIATTLKYDPEQGFIKVPQSEFSTLNVGGKYNGIQSACNLYYGDIASGSKELNYASNNGLESGIVSAYLAPLGFVGPEVPGPLMYSVSRRTTPITKTDSVNKKYDNINGYVPKNNKLFCFPYNFITATDLNGNTAVYNYEDFSTATCGFSAQCTITPNPEGLFWPNSYKGQNNNYNEAMTINNFPQVPYIVDSYRAWLAQTQSSRAVSNLHLGASLVGALVTTPFTGGASAVALGSSMALQVGQQVAQYRDHEVQPQQMRGNASSNVLVANNIKDIHLIATQIKYEYAETIDNYLSNFGYKVNVVKVPNLSGRASWNYCETVGCIVRGNMPNSARIEIQEMFNNGITLWHGDYIGDYSRANVII